MTTTANIFTRHMTRLRRISLTPDEQNDNNMIIQTIGDFIDPQRQQRYITQIHAIRDLCHNLNEKKRNSERIATLKKTLPGGIVSGVAKGGISEDNIIKRNGVICIDIDAKDNPTLYDWEAVKQAISKSPYVAYIGLSVSGLGLFVLIPIADPNQHEKHYNAIVQDFSNNTFTIKQNEDSEPTILHGIQLDKSPKNIASKRFVSYDPKPYINTNAKVYNKTIEPITLYVKRFTSYHNGKSFDVERFLNKHNIHYNCRERHGGLQYIVTCPWSELHSSKSRAESAIFVYPDGRIGYKCMHSHCEDKDWQQYREFYEPDAYHKHTLSFPRLADVDIHALLPTLQATDIHSRLERMQAKNQAIGQLIRALDLELINDFFKPF